jgi:hypothetical protein
VVPLPGRVVSPFLLLSGGARPKACGHRDQTRQPNVHNVSADTTILDCVHGAGWPALETLTVGEPTSLPPLAPEMRPGDSREIGTGLKPLGSSRDRSLSLPGPLLRGPLAYAPESRRKNSGRSSRMKRGSFRRACSRSRFGSWIAGMCSHSGGTAVTGSRRGWSRLPTQIWTQW